MSLKKKVAVAIIVSFVFVQASAGFEPRPITPIAQTAFRPVELYEPTVAPTPLPTPKITARPAAPVPKPKLYVEPTVKPKKVYGRMVKGLASYYCCTKGYPAGGYYAAVGPALRVAMGGGYAANAKQPWKGKTVKVCGFKGCERVTLVDWCQCYWKQSQEKVIDLYKGLFFHIGAERGIVTISW